MATSRTRKTTSKTRTTKRKYPSTRKKPASVDVLIKREENRLEYLKKRKKLKEVREAVNQLRNEVNN